MATRRHECNKSKTHPTYSKEWSGVTYAPAAKGRKCSQCGKHVHKESGEYYCPHCDDYVKTIGSFGAKKSKPKNIGNHSCFTDPKTGKANCIGFTYDPTALLATPVTLPKKPNAEVKFMKGVNFMTVMCPDPNNCGSKVTINKTSSAPLIKVFNRSPNNATVKTIQAGTTIREDGSIIMTSKAFQQFQLAVNAKRPTIFTDARRYVPKGDPRIKYMDCSAGTTRCPSLQGSFGKRKRSK